MLSLFRMLNAAPQRRVAEAARRAAFVPEGLEARTLLSVAHPSIGQSAYAMPAGSASVVSLKHANAGGTSGTSQSTVAFSAAPTAVQTGLTSLAQGTTIPADQVLHVRTPSTGTSVYATTLSINGLASRIAVDASGNPLEGRLAFGDAPSAVQAGLQALDTAGTIPASQLVQVNARRAGHASTATTTTVYSTTVTINGAATRIAVDSTGAAIIADQKNRNEQTVLFSAAPAAVQAALTALAQGITITGTQALQVRTSSTGTSVYSTSVTVNGVVYRIAVDATGKALEGAIAFSAAPAAVQTGLQALDTAGTIPASQLVQIHTSGGHRGESGTTVYSTSVTLNGVATTIAVDATGATVSTGNHGTGSNHQTILFSAAPAAVQTGLQAIDGGVTLAASQQVQVNTDRNGSTVYQTLVTFNGQDERVAVDATGKALEGVVAFGAAPTAVQTGLQGLDTAGTIPATQLVQINSRPDGTTVYSTSVTLSGVATTIAVDSTGATVTNSGFGGHGGGGGFGGEGHGSGFGGFGGHRGH